MADVDVTTTSSLGVPDHMFAVNQKIRFLMFSSFSTGNITLGFQVVQRSNTTVQPGILHPYVARSVRDDSSGLMINIADHAECQVSEITVCTQLSPGHREQAFLVLSTPILQKALHAPSKMHQQHLLQTAVLYSYYSLDMRQCPKCGSNAFIACTCTLGLTTKKHPMDFEADRSNIETFTGGFDGVSTLALYANGLENFRGNYVTKASAGLMWDHDSSIYLGGWAMRHTLRDAPVNALNLQMPLNELQSTQPDQHALIAVAEIEQPANDLFAAEEVQWFEEANQTGGEEEVVGEVCRLVDDLQNAARREEVADQESEGNRASVRILEKESVEDSENESDKGSPTSIESFPVQPSMENAVSSEIIATTAATTLQPFVPVQPLIPSVLQPVRPIAVPQNRIGRPPTQKRTPPVFLVPLAPAASGSVIQVRTVPSAFSEDLRRREEIRKARNRASAHKSNLKKKQQVEKLKEDLRVEKEKEASLRQNERSLREDNLALRSALSK